MVSGISGVMPVENGTVRYRADWPIGPAKQFPKTGLNVFQAACTQDIFEEQFRSLIAWYKKGTL